MILTGGNKERFIHPGSLTAGTGTGTVADDVLTCSTTGTFYVRSNQANGEWEFEFEKGADGNRSDINFISDVKTGVTATSTGYRIVLFTDESIYFQYITGGTGLSKFKTAASYISNNTRYKILIQRLKSAGKFKLIGDDVIYPSHTFAVFIKGGAFTDWTLVDTTGGSGSNPITDSTYTSSEYLVADLDASDKIGTVKYKNWV